MGFLMDVIRDGRRQISARSGYNPIQGEVEGSGLYPEFSERPLFTMEKGQTVSPQPSLSRDSLEPSVAQPVREALSEGDARQTGKAAGETTAIVPRSEWDLSAFFRSTPESSPRKMNGDDTGVEGEDGVTQSRAYPSEVRHTRTLRSHEMPVSRETGSACEESEHPLLEPGEPEPGARVPDPGVQVFGEKVTRNQDFALPGERARTALESRTTPEEVSWKAVPVSNSPVNQDATPQRVTVGERRETPGDAGGVLEEKTPASTVEAPESPEAKAFGAFLSEKQAIAPGPRLREQNIPNTQPRVRIGQVNVIVQGAGETTRAKPVTGHTEDLASRIFLRSL